MPCHVIAERLPAAHIHRNRPARLQIIHHQVNPGVRRPRLRVRLHLKPRLQRRMIPRQIEIRHLLLIKFVKRQHPPAPGPPQRRLLIELLPVHPIRRPVPNPVPVARILRHRRGLIPRTGTDVHIPIPMIRHHRPIRRIHRRKLPPTVRPLPPLPCLSPEIHPCQPIRHAAPSPTPNLHFLLPLNPIPPPLPAMLILQRHAPINPRHPIRAALPRPRHLPPHLLIPLIPRLLPQPTLPPSRPNQHHPNHHPHHHP